MAEARIFTGTIKEISDGIAKNSGYEYSYIRFEEHPPVYNVRIPQGMKQALFQVCDSGKPGEFYFLDMGIIRTADGSKKEATVLLAFCSASQDAVCISTDGSMGLGAANLAAWAGIAFCVSLGTLLLFTIVGIPASLALFRLANGMYQQAAINRDLVPTLVSMLDVFRQKYPNALRIGDLR